MLVQDQPIVCTPVSTIAPTIDNLLDSARVKCDTRLYQLITWWDMKPFPVVRLLNLVRTFQEGVSAHQPGPDAPMTAEEIADVVKSIKEYGTELDACYLSSAGDHCRRIATNLERGATSGETILQFAEVMNRIEDESKRHVFMVVEPEMVKYATDNFDSSDPTAPKVSAAFTTAADDIAEAGKCLVMGRSTACVMHLSRVIEVGLSALAKELAIPAQNDWGRYLKEIDAELNRRLKASGARSPDEQFYAEASINIDCIRRAWRNPTMHVAKTHTMEQAEDIYVTVRSFMRHLATKLHD